jgi:hypothetical protein
VTEHLINFILQRKDIKKKREKRVKKVRKDAEMKKYLLSQKQC